MTLAQALLVGPQDQRDVREHRHRRTDRLVQHHLLRRVRDVVVATHHMRDLHLHIVRHHGKVIRRLAIRAQDHEVLDVHAVERDGPMDEILELHGSLWHANAYGPRTPVALARSDFIPRQRQTRAVVAERAARPLRGLALRPQLFRRAIAVVGVTARDERGCHCAVAVEALGLEVRGEGAANLRALVPVKAQPPHPVEDALDHFVRGPRNSPCNPSADFRTSPTA